ncbi:citramalate synthase [Candidatus Marinamargulisbacteria bacterium SCGC AG-439-L15]|nr:citramalate synthase [Candidatus Marinamargulisbacteria bacterium SCGC AG-439-L15]
MSSKISILDTTLRDGEQGEGISFTLEDKLSISTLLDNLGIHYIEGGWPDSNPKAKAYFDTIRNTPLKHSKVTAFGSTRRAKNTAENDTNLQALVDTKPDTCVIFGKSWDFHVTDALKIDLETNLEMIQDSVRFLKSHNFEVIYDAEHFFDGYKKNPDYAIKTLKAAADGGVDILCLCDTNGGTLPSEVNTIVSTVKNTFSCEIGIHTHNDSDLGVANAIAAVESGATHIQGTLNGYGERCGNANLSAIIPILMLKMGYSCISKDQLTQLTASCYQMDEIANMTPHTNQAFVGKSAFAHKGGIHVSAILKNSDTYEHINPEAVGNNQRVLISELSGASNLVYKAKELGLNLDTKNKDLPLLLDQIKSLESEGYQFEGAGASFELLMRKTLGLYTPHIKLDQFKVLNEQKGEDQTAVKASIKATLNNKTMEMDANGTGPVGALDHALRQLLESIFPVIKTVKLIDYKVRVLDSKDSTDAKVRVLITSYDGNQTWNTIGVSENIIKASWLALADSFEYKLLLEERS